VLLQAARAEAEAYHTATMQDAETADTSIITEAAPSELDAYADAADRQPAAAAEALALPFIGNKPLAAQQRILGGTIVVGIAGLLLMMFLALNSASRNAAQLNASGQALMQSQRLAKSVSQAAIGNAKAFGEVHESSEALSRSVLGLQRGDAELAAAPQEVQEAIAPLVPLVERAPPTPASSCAPAGADPGRQALQAVNRQTSALLQTAEGISLIKLQQEWPRTVGSGSS
jgi:twitching motility protein PilJ